MRRHNRRTLPALALALALGLAGCGDSGTDDSATDDIPPPTARAGRDITPNTDHNAHATSTCSPSGNTVTIVAEGTKFDTDCLAAPANQPLTLSFENKDTLPHNIAFLESHSASEVMFRADIFAGPKTSTFSVGPFKPGSYAFHCEVHPTLMSGSFTVR
jgi:plastocyanin